MIRSLDIFKIIVYQKYEFICLGKRNIFQDNSGNHLKELRISTDLSLCLYVIVSISISMHIC